MRIRTLAACAAALGALALVFGPTASGGNPTAAKAKRVGVRDNSFTPKTVTVSAGGSVTWTWKGSSDHNVTFRSVPKGASKKPRARTRSSGHFTRTFTKRGKYRYVCTIHESVGMTGTVVAK